VTRLLCRFEAGEKCIFLLIRFLAQLLGLAQCEPDIGIRRESPQEESAGGRPIGYAASARTCRVGSSLEMNLCLTSEESWKRNERLLFRKTC